MTFTPTRTADAWTKRQLHIVNQAPDGCEFIGKDVLPRALRSTLRHVLQFFHCLFAYPPLTHLQPAHLCAWPMQGAAMHIGGDVDELAALRTLMRRSVSL